LFVVNISRPCANTTGSQPSWVFVKSKRLAGEFYWYSCGACILSHVLIILVMALTF